MPEGQRKSNALKHDQIIDLHSHLVRNLEMFQEHEMTASQVAQHASAHLGFRVVDNNILGLMGKGRKIPFKWKHGSRIDSTLDQRMDIVIRTLGVLMDDLNVSLDGHGELGALWQSLREDAEA